MSVRLYLTIAAIVAILYALAFLIVPIQASLFFSSFAEARAVLYLRFCGAAVLAWGLIVWFARDFQDWRAVRSVLIGSMGPPPSDLLGHRSEEKAPEDRPDVADRRHERAQMRIEVMLDLQKQAGVGILGAVAEEIKCGHENDAVHREFPVAPQDFQDAHARGVLLLLPCRRLVDSPANEENEDGGNYPEREHIAPAEAVI